MKKMNPWLAVLRTTGRILTFRATREELLALDHRHLVFGLLCTWIVGMGRWWDDPGANLLQHLGLGSVIYVFMLSTLLWLVMWPLRPQSWSFNRLLTFITLTSPPAILYAIPVERYYPVETAAQMNAYFLAIVAAWRVALLVFYLRRLGQMPPLRVLVGTALPIMLIVATLTVLNLHRVVFEIMGGIRTPGAHDTAYFILLGITMLSFYGALPMLCLCIFACTRARAESAEA
jgi:hypothetical protein